MLYNSYSNPYQYPQNMPNMPQYPNMTQEPPKQQIQYSVVNSPSIEYAQNYPVAPGNSVSFKIENQPYLCTKTMGFSPLEKPIFEVYRLVKEDNAIAEKTDNKPDYVVKADLEPIEKRLSDIEKALKPMRRKSKAEETADDPE